MYQRKELTKHRMIWKLDIMLAELSNIDVQDLTTFELSFLRSFAENPPENNRGAEDKILADSPE